ncbi:hypothetical protein A6V36_32430 [Paraburkholderia ginsengiterrae]|uniref:Uncharacterized protein n=1 Tax=Paraburkholderia ginsengiterrae TaxID=1462993 RepID=A0A1A9N3A9_9BURK|nr:DUF5677 domain-containing protein [Paraburkholderia ginsengiterrae]OAJ56900.1 hypothetical protein A6V37_30410 [Paraburkholderia ginsengiterrae]OAJ56957.1 hypothetical protein A6V36_32430 [Paraburkholderia ginsengiterrae]
MSIDELGFLSNDVTHWIGKHRADNAAWFSFAERLNRLGQSLLHGLSVTTGEGQDSRLLAMLLFTRTLSNFQGAILMAERGMIVEARTLARSCLESTFCLAAMECGKEDFANEFRRATLQSRKARANFILKVPDRLQYTDVESADRLRAYAARLNEYPEDLSSLKFEQLAERVGLADMYLFYRQLSADSAHPSIEALCRYIGDAGNVKWGPNCDSTEIGDTVNIACHFLIGACAYINDIAQNDEFANSLGAHFTEYKELNGVK